MWACSPPPTAGVVNMPGWVPITLMIAWNEVRDGSRPAVNAGDPPIGAGYWFPVKS
jgi:hypothetical protein